MGAVKQKSLNTIKTIKTLKYLEKQNPKKFLEKAVLSKNRLSILFSSISIKIFLRPGENQHNLKKGSTETLIKTTKNYKQ